ncbi:MAG: hypothetical protein ACXAEN_25855 [Candidatus Thorarchaeota archaeon]|jgi:hypothetical protein
MTLLPNTPAVNDAYYFGFLSQTTDFKLNITTSGDWTGSSAWEYWDGDSWEALAGLSDGTDQFEAAAGWHTVSWTLPGDWATTAVDGKTAYWVRLRVTAYVGVTTQPLGGQAKVDGWSHVYDRALSWANDAYNDMYFILTDGMAGKKTWGTGPYDRTMTTGGALSTDDDTPEVLWVDDSNTDQTKDQTDEWTVDYDFHMILGHDTPSNFYTHSSISAASIVLSYTWWRTTGSPYITVYIEDQSNPGNYLTIVEELPRGNNIQSTFNLPGQYLDNLVGSDGDARVRFEIFDNTDWVSFEPMYLRLEVTTETTGYSSTTVINDTINSYSLSVERDFTTDAAATCIWDEAPYCIGIPIYKYIDSAETPGTLITDGDALSSKVNGAGALVCAGTIEHTSGISTRQFNDRTRLDILKALARQDKAVFWCTLGGTTITYKSTFNAAPAGEYALTDAKILSWRPKYDWSTVYNEYDVYGMRIGDQQLKSNATDATSIAKYGATRQQAIKNTGLVSEYDTSAIGTALVNQTKDVQLMLGCTIAGNTATAAHSNTIKLGDELDITSTDLGLTNAKYIINSWSYDSRSNVTTLMLHPRVSATGLSAQTDDYYSTSKTAISGVITRQERDKYVPAPYTNEVS